MQASATEIVKEVQHIKLAGHTDIMNTNRIESLFLSFPLDPWSLFSVSDPSLIFIYTLL